MRRFDKPEDSATPFGKILAISAAALLLIGGVMWGVDRLQSGDRVRQLVAIAKDDYEAGRYEAGLDAIRRALKIAETPEALEAQMALLLAQEKDYEAEFALEKLIAMRPNEPDYYYRSATLAFQNGDQEKALRVINKACALQPRNSDYAVSRANLLVHADRLDEATPYYRALIARDPRFFTGWESYTNALLNAKRTQEALALSRQGVKQFPNDEDFVFRLAQTLDRAHLNSEAVREYRHFLEIHPMQDSIAAQRILEMTGKRVDPRLEAMRSFQLPFRVDHNVMLIRARVNGEEGLFLLDTGASLSVIFQNRAQRYHVQPREAFASVSTGNGRITVPIADADITLGPFSSFQSRVAISPAVDSLPADGIIGMDVMQAFRFEVDHSRRVITLTR